MDFTKFEQFGPQWLFMGIVLFILYRMIIWVMAFVKEQNACHGKERETWLEVMTSMKQSIDTHNLNSLEMRSSVAEAHRFQREEHMKQLEKSDIICASLKEVEAALGRINGYIK